MATTYPEEKYRFNNVNDMEKAAVKAFGSVESMNCYYEKGLILNFRPTGSLIYDSNARAMIKKYGGEEISDFEKAKI